MTRSLQKKRRLYISGIVLLVSLASHGLLLNLPLPRSIEAETQPDSPFDESEDISVVILSEQDALAEAVPELPEEAVLDIAPESFDQAEASNAEPVEIAPEPSLPDESELLPEQDLESLPSPDENLPIEDSTTSNYTPPASPPADTPLVVFGDAFPHPAGAVGGCFGLSECNRVAGGGSYRSVAQSLITNLESQGYSTSERDDLDDTGRRIYELLPPGDNGSVQYLMVFSDVDGSTVYVMGDRILTLSELQTLNAQTNLNDQSG
ncbi:MAG: hypothetical protein F6K42_20330 [Leptolyngbya sp. SIO1D8]|nr:hypothetical protein [Leptolyngbya sp. SIO1D8]